MFSKSDSDNCQEEKRQKGLEDGFPLKPGDSITDALPALVSYVDRNLVYRWVNHAYEVWFGCTRQEIVGRPVAEVLGPEIFSRIEARLKLAIRGEQQIFETLAIASDGRRANLRVTYVPRYEGQEVLGTYVLAIDETEQKESERTLLLTLGQLENRNDRLAVALSAAKMGEWSFSLEKMSFELSSSAGAMLGFGGAVGVGYEALALRLDPRGAAALWGALHVPGEVHDHVSLEISLRQDLNTAVCWVALHGRRVRNASGVVVSIFGVASDITERKQTEEALKRALDHERVARASAERANQAKDDFLAILSHELRTPLNGVLGWAQILSRDVMNASVVARGADVIAKSARLQAQLIEDLLDVSRVLTGKVELAISSVSMSNIVRDALHTASGAAQAKGITLVEQVPSEPLFLEADQQKLQQIVGNLISNALKFTPEGGTVTVTVTPGNGNLTLAVADTGIGVAKEFLPFMFDRFQQSEEGRSRRFGGLGLGLALVKSFVNLHHGEVSAHSDGIGKGCTITVCLPVTRHHPEAVQDSRSREITVRELGYSEPLQSPVHLPLCGYRVLIIDDDPNSLDLAAHVFRDQGAEVGVAENAEVALEKVRAMFPDLVVSDIGLPGMDGLEFIRTLRTLERQKNHRKTPSLAMSAFVSERDQQEAQDAGFTAYVPKPIDINELQRTAIKAIADMH